MTLVLTLASIKSLTLSLRVWFGGESLLVSAKDLCTITASTVPTLGSAAGLVRSIRSFVQTLP